MANYTLSSNLTTGNNFTNISSFNTFTHSTTTTTVGDFVIWPDSGTTVPNVVPTWQTTVGSINITHPFTGDFSTKEIQKMLDELRDWADSVHPVKIYEYGEQMELFDPRDYEI